MNDVTCYTVGDPVGYLEAIKRNGRIEKKGREAPSPPFPEGYPGGIVFETLEAAQAHLNAKGLHWMVVFGLKDVQWGVDTAPAEDGSTMHHLLKDAEIIVIEAQIPQNKGKTTRKKKVNDGADQPLRQTKQGQS